MSLTQKKVTVFLDELASESAAPGGGSVSALAGALGSALAAMVARVTLGKKKYAAVEEEMKRLVPAAEELRRRLTECVDRDTQAFTEVMAAFALPKNTDEEKGRRSQAVESAMQNATRVPLEVMELCRAAMDLADAAARKGNTNAVSDAGVSALVIQAACRGAWYNVMINTLGLRDGQFASDVKAKASLWMKQVDERATAVRNHVESTFANG